MNLKLYFSGQIFLIESGQICSDCEAEFSSRVEAERHLADAGNGCRNAPKAVYPCAVCRGREGDHLWMLYLRHCKNQLEKEFIFSAGQKFEFLGCVMLP